MGAILIVLGQILSFLPLSEVITRAVNLGDMAAVQSLRYKQTSRGKEDNLVCTRGFSWASKHPEQRSPGLPGMATTSGADNFPIQKSLPRAGGLL